MTFKDSFTNEIIYVQFVETLINCWDIKVVVDLVFGGQLMEVEGKTCMSVLSGLGRVVERVLWML